MKIGPITFVDPFEVKNGWVATALFLSYVVCIGLVGTVGIMLIGHAILLATQLLSGWVIALIAVALPFLVVARWGIRR